MKYTVFTALTIALLASACGGGGGGNDESVSSVPQAATDMQQSSSSETSSVAAGSTVFIPAAVQNLTPFAVVAPAQQAPILTPDADQSAPAPTLAQFATPEQSAPALPQPALPPQKAPEIVVTSAVITRLIDQTPRSNAASPDLDRKAQLETLGALATKAETWQNVLSKTASASHDSLVSAAVEVCRYYAQRGLVVFSMSTPQARPAEIQYAANEAGNDAQECRPSYYVDKTDQELVGYVMTPLQKPYAEPGEGQMIAIPPMAQS